MAATPSNASIRSSKANPCPICGRAKDGDCEMRSDGRVFCHRGASHHPPDGLKPGEVHNGYAYLGDSDLGKAMFKPDEGKAKGKPRLRVVPSPSRHLLARLPHGAEVPDLNREKATYSYGPRQETRRNTAGKGGKVMPWHLKGRQWACGAGPDPWPLYQEELATGSDGWILELEGERCAALAMAGGVVAISQPGHNLKPDDIEARYSRLAAAGVDGVAYVADHDQEGARKAEKLTACAAAAGLPFTVLHAADVWPGIPEKGSIDDAPGTAADQVAALEEALHRARAHAPADEPQGQQQPAPEAPFRILGWSVKLDAIWVQTGQTGTVAAIPPTKNGLQRIAPIAYWETLYPGRAGCGWDAAVSSVCTEAHDLRQTFTPDRIRGRGVWLDNNRVVWHLGNRLEVDGHLQPLTTLRDTGWTYGSLPALQIDPTVAPLTDTEGAAILELLHDRMQWDNPGDGLLMAGSIVLGNICGALDIRPGMQITGPSQAGKSTLERTMIRPLQAGLGVRPSGATEAGIRQRMQSDALPVVIDESEQEAAKQREGHLKLMRLSYDGQEQIKGTAGGQALTFTMRSSVTLIGINATVPNLADRNRMAILRPHKLPPAQWAEFMLQRDALVTTEAGARLVRRSVSGLKALLANIKTFQSVVVGLGLASRSAEVYGSLLAGAHHLTSTAALTPSEALTWLDSKDWSGLDGETTEAIASDVEGHACLDHLLGHAVLWKGSQTGAIDVRELLAIVKGLRPAAATDGSAAKALGRLGVKLDPEKGLVVSNACRIFTDTRWANGAHRDRLLELEGADRIQSAVWFTGGGTHRAVCIPMELAS